MNRVMCTPYPGWSRLEGAVPGSRWLQSGRSQDAIPLLLLGKAPFTSPGGREAEGVPVLKKVLLPCHWCGSHADKLADRDGSRRCVAPVSLPLPLAT